MASFFKLKKKILINNYLPLPLGKFRFIHFNQINQSNFLKLVNVKRVRGYFSKSKKITRKEHDNYISNYMKKSIINFVLIEKKSKNIVGIFNLKKTKIGVEIGKYILNKNYLGKGIAKKATINLIDFVFKRTNEKKIFAITNVENNINLLLNTKLGFKINAVKKNFYIMELTNVRFYNFYLKKK